MTSSPTAINHLNQWRPIAERPPTDGWYVACNPINGVQRKTIIEALGRTWTYDLPKTTLYYNLTFASGSRASLAARHLSSPGYVDRATSFRAMDTDGAPQTEAASLPD